MSDINFNKIATLPGLNVDLSRLGETPHIGKFMFVHFQPNQILSFQSQDDKEASHPGRLYYVENPKANSSSEAEEKIWMNNQFIPCKDEQCTPSAIRKKLFANNVGQCVGPAKEGHPQWGIAEQLDISIQKLVPVGADETIIGQGSRGFIDSADRSLFSLKVAVDKDKDGVIDAIIYGVIQFDPKLDHIVMTVPAIINQTKNIPTTKSGKLPLPMTKPDIANVRWTILSNEGRLKGPLPFAAFCRFERGAKIVAGGYLSDDIAPALK